MALWGVGIMVGPILGPTLGGYLTEQFDWRWVFYINLPVGVLCLMGVSAFLTETEKQDRPFDMFGFFTLSITIAAIQLILDRGDQEDWFNSIEIIIYCSLVAGMFWMFLAHTRYAKHPFLSSEMFRDKNYVMSLVFMFFVGIILLATLALLPPFLQNQMGYPVMDVGIMMAPRGVGTMIGMIIVGKASGKIDPRKMILLGMALLAYSLWEMTQFDSYVPQSWIISSGIFQGLGLGFVFVPLSTVAFATLDQKYRTEAAGLFSLVRNMGSSIGVSIVITMLGISIQTNHSYLSENITPYNTGLAQQYMPQALNNSTTALNILNAEINKQAATIGYINDFSIMMWIVIFIMPLVFFLSNPLKREEKELSVNAGVAK